MNVAILVGNLGSAPELRMTAGGTAVCKFRLATTRSTKDSQGNWSDATEWHSVIVWGNRGEAMAKILAKGSKVAIRGELRTSSWDDANGKKHFSTEIHCSEIDLCGEPRRASGAD